MEFFFDNDEVYVEKKKYKCYLISQKNLSDWYFDSGLLDKTWLKKARQYGLGAVRDVYLTIGIECENTPRFQVVLYTKLLDGFFGPDPLKEIDETEVARWVEAARKNGWPNKEGLVIKIKETFQGDQKPMMLVLPNMNDDVEYDQVDEATMIWKKEDTQNPQSNR